MHRPHFPAPASGHPIQFDTYYVSNFVWARSGATTPPITFYEGKVLRVAALAMAFVTYYVSSAPAAQDARATQNQLGAEVVKAYLNIRKAREAVAAIEAGVKAYEAGVAAAHARYEAGQMLKADLLSLEVEQARLAHDDARERLADTAQAVQQAGESAALSRARFEKGALLTADLIGVESRLIEARMRRAVAAADERIALADLRRALGLAPLAQP